MCRYWQRIWKIPAEKKIEVDEGGHSSALDAMVEYVYLDATATVAATEKERFIRFSFGDVYIHVLRNGKVRAIALRAKDGKALEQVRLAFRLEQDRLALRHDDVRRSERLQTEAPNDCSITEEARALLLQALAIPTEKPKGCEMLYAIENGKAVLQESSSSFRSKLGSVKDGSRMIEAFVLPPGHRAAPKDACFAGFGLRALVDIPVGTIIGLYSHGAHVHANDQLFGDLKYLSRYEVDVLDDVSIIGTPINDLALMNCCTDSKCKRRRHNCVFDTFIVVTNSDTPDVKVYVFAEIVQPVPKDREILSCYGQAYWRHAKLYEDKCARATAVIMEKICERRDFVKAPQLKTLHFKKVEGEAEEDMIKRLTEQLREERPVLF
jgi:hypothetical protein